VVPEQPSLAEAINEDLRTRLVAAVSDTAGGAYTTTTEPNEQAAETHAGRHPLLLLES